MARCLHFLIYGLGLSHVGIATSETKVWKYTGPNGTVIGGSFFCDDYEAIRPVLPILPLSDTSANGKPSFFGVMWTMCEVKALPGYTTNGDNPMNCTGEWELSARGLLSNPEISVQPKDEYVFCYHEGVSVNVKITKNNEAGSMPTWAWVLLAIGVFGLCLLPLIAWMCSGKKSPQKTKSRTLKAPRTSEAAAAPLAQAPLAQAPLAQAPQAFAPVRNAAQPVVTTAAPTPVYYVAHPMQMSPATMAYAAPVVTYAQPMAMAQQGYPAVPTLAPTQMA